MKILFIFTGGTIGSTEVCGVRSADAKGAYVILEKYRARYGIDFEYETYEPYTELSENLSGEHIGALISAVHDRLSLGYDGIIVTHGTDTIQYSAAALSYALGLDTVPVCLVSANAPIESAESNGLINLRCAVEFIRLHGGRGVFSVYANAEITDSEGSAPSGFAGDASGCGGVFDDGGKCCVRYSEVLVHRGTRLMPPYAFSDKEDSIFGEHYGVFDENLCFTKNKRYREAKDETKPIYPTELSEQSREILVLTPYVGMTYPSLDGVKYLILNTYHSGTLNVKSSAAREFFAEARKRGISVFAVGTMEGLDYSTTAEYTALGIIPLRNISPISAYMKLWLLTGNGRSADDISLSLGGDRVI